MKVRIAAIVLIGLASAGLFIFGFWLMLKYELVRFDWTDRIMQRIEYRKVTRADRKVLILGDSQLERWPFDHCLNLDIAELMEENDFGHVNAAHHGFGPSEHLQQLKEVVLLYKPDLILIFYYAGNDLTDITYRENNSYKKRTYPVQFGSTLPPTKNIETAEDEKASQPNPKEEFDWELFRRVGIDTQLIHFAKNRVEGNYKVASDHVNPHMLAVASWKPDFQFDNCTYESGTTRYGWYKVFKAYEGIMRIADSIGSEVVITVIPSPVQVDTSYYTFYRKLKLRVSYDLLFADTPQKMLHEFSSASQITFIDLIPFFKSSTNPGNLYLKNDDHLNDKGHKLAFSVLRDKFLDKWIKESPDIKRHRKKNIYLKYERNITDYQAELIRQDSVWYAAVQKKAGENGISVDSQLYMDALYMVNIYRSDLK